MNIDLERTEELIGLSKRKKSKKMLIIAGIFLAIIAAGAGIFAGIMLHEGNQPSDKLMLAQKYLEEGKYEQAIEAFDEVIKLDDKNADAYEGLGMAYARSGNYEKAKEPFRNATKNDSKNKDRYNRIAEVAVDNNDFDFADDVIDDMHKNIPDSKSLKIEDFTKDRKAYQKVLNTIMQENKLDVENPIDEGVKENLLYEDMDFDMSENRFALADVDGDGKQELLFEANTTYTVYMHTYVLKYNEKTGKVDQINAVLKPTFYENKDINSGFAHQPSPGTSGFIFDKFDSKNKKWDRTYIVRYEKEYFTEGENYPEKEDKNKNGIVYVKKKWSEEKDNYEIIEYIDDDKYPDWEKKLLSSKEVKIDYMDFTQENIDGILKTSTKPAVKKEKKKSNPNIDEALYKKIEGNWTTVGQSQRPVVIKDYKIYFYNKGEESPESALTIIATQEYADGVYIYKTEGGPEYVLGDETDEDALICYTDYASREGYSVSSSLKR